MQCTFDSVVKVLVVVFVLGFLFSNNASADNLDNIRDMHEYNDAVVQRNMDRFGHQPRPSYPSMITVTPSYKTGNTFIQRSDGSGAMVTPNRLDGGYTIYNY